MSKNFFLPRRLTAEERRRVRRAASVVLRVAIVLSAIFCAACAATRYFYPNHIIDMLANFLLHYLLAGLVLASLSATLRFRAGVLLALALVLFQLPAFWPYFFGGSRSHEPANLRVAVANVYGANRNFGAFGDWIADVRPDVILLQETEDRWQNYLDLIKDEYPHVATAQSTQWGFSARIYSRHPLVASEVIKIPPCEIPFLRVVIEVNGRSVAIYNTHLYLSGGVRDQQNATLREVIQGETLPLVFAGDFNATIWSSGQRKLVDGLDIRDAAFGFGYMSTWPARLRPLLQGAAWILFNSTRPLFSPHAAEFVAPLVARWAGVPLDHAYVSPEIGVVSCDRGPNINSDHLPLLFDFHIPAESNEH